MRNIKRLIAGIMTLALASANISMVFANPDEVIQDTITDDLVLQKKYMKVNTSSLNVRSEPSTSGNKLGSLPRGTKVEVIEQSGSWFKIIYKDGYGWCSGDYLVPEDTSTNDNNTNEENSNNNSSSNQEKKYMKVNISSLNVRNGPSTSNEKIGNISRGTRVEVLSQSGKWYKISYKNGYGWCSGDYLVTDSSSSTDNNENNTQNKKYKKVNTSSLNVRNGPSTSNKKIGSLSKGTMVEVLQQSGKWFKIVYKNSYGWCMGDYLVDENSSINNNLTKGNYIVIKTSNNTMAYYKDGKLISQHRVATGKKSTPTPKGKFKIVNKIVNRPYYKDKIPGGDPRNPLGKRWLGLQVGSTYGTTYAIHGNNNENSIGSHISGGCIRMHNKEVEWLFNQVPIGTQVIISGSNQTFKQIALSYKVNLE